MIEISIGTPVYNRAKNIITLYKSLCSQTNQQFEWIIVDDGSSDDISDTVDTFEANFKISFIQKKNGGKCSALNMALKYCKTKWFFVVDSDDYLVPEAVEKIYKKINMIDEKNNIVGIVAYRKFTNGKISGNQFPKDKLYVGYNELNYHYNQDGETALIYKTDILKRHKHKVYKDENFLSEEIQYNEIDKEGDLLVLAEPLIVMEYLENGLTNNYFKNWINNPKGTKLLLNSKYVSVRKLSKTDIMIKKIKTLIQFDVLNIYSSNFKMEESPNEFFSICFYPIAFLLRRYINKRN